MTELAIVPMTAARWHLEESAWCLRLSSIIHSFRRSLSLGLRFTIWCWGTRSNGRRRRISFGSCALRRHCRSSFRLPISPSTAGTAFALASGVAVCNDFNKD